MAMAMEIQFPAQHHHRQPSSHALVSHAELAPIARKILVSEYRHTSLSCKHSSFTSPLAHPHHSFASLPSCTQRLLIPQLPRKRAICARAQLNLPLVPASNHWAMWSVLLSVAAFGIWSERTTWGSSLSGALVSTLVGLAASNAGLIPSKAPAYTVVNKFLMPLSVPLLLFSADLRVVVSSTGRLLLAFCLGSVATVVGTIVAMMVVPLHSLGADGWKIAAALMSRHIGGDDSTNQVSPNNRSGPRAYLLENATALALSACICTVGVYCAQALGFRGGDIPCITVLVVLLATICPSWVGSFAPAGETLAVMLIQIFFAVVGATASVSSVVGTATQIFLFSLVQIAIHLLLVLSVGSLLAFDQKHLLVASNANVGGPTTAASLTTAKGWKELIVPGILVGIFGVAIATFIAIFLGLTVLKQM